MDINEVSGTMKSRHPWELSRTKCILESIQPYLSGMQRSGKKGRIRYLNIGAGDLYFDHALLKRYRKHSAYAVDIGYDSDRHVGGNIQKFRCLEEIEEDGFDYALLMDSLEYMEDDMEYITQLCNKLNKGAWLFFTLPAFQKLWSDHDVIVKLLRRYDRKSFLKQLGQMKQITIIEEHYFYFTLLCIRGIQKMLRLPIDPGHKVTAGWRFQEKGWVTKLVTGCLNLDFKIGVMLKKYGICLPGLSIFVVCRKD